VHVAPLPPPRGRRGEREPDLVRDEVRRRVDLHYVLGYRGQLLSSDEIINRYYYKKGVYENHIYHSEYILKAAEILRDQDRYRQILQGR
jgi:hypothetical protein